MTDPVYIAAIRDAVARAHVDLVDAGADPDVADSVLIILCEACFACTIEGLFDRLGLPIPLDQEDDAA